jgi:hypothetical protein
MDLPIQFPLLLSVDQDQIQPVLERLKRGGDGGFFTHVLVEIPTVRFDLSALHARVDLTLREGFEETPVFLAITKGVNLPVDDLGDEIPESERSRAFVRGGGNGEGKTG